MNVLRSTADPQYIPLQERRIHNHRPYIAKSGIWKILTPARLPLHRKLPQLTEAIDILRKKHRILRLQPINPGNFPDAPTKPRGKRIPGKQTDRLQKGSGILRRDRDFRRILPVQQLNDMLLTEAVHFQRSGFLHLKDQLRLAVPQNSDSLGKRRVSA